MRYCFLVAALGLSVFATIAPSGHSGPLDGIYAKKTDVPGEGLKMTKRFRGGERGSVQVTRSSKGDTTVHVAVFDEQNKIVAEDTGRTVPASNMVAVVWYPPRDAEYRIEIRNTEKTAATYFIAIR